MKKIVTGLIAATLILVACSSKDEGGSRSSVDLLQYVPSDTPYIFAAARGLPDDLADKVEPTIDQMLKTYQRILRHLMAEKLGSSSTDTDSDPDAEQFRALAEELLGLMSIDGLRSAGVARGSAFALYGNGLLPVLRMELSDAKLFDETIARLESKAGQTLAVGVAGGHEYKYFDLEKVKLVVATLDGQAVISAFPAQFDEAQVSLALGISAPQQSLKESGGLKAIQKEYDFTDYMTGFVDAVRIAEIITGDATGLDVELFAATEYAVPELSDVCRAEVMQVVGVMPRVVLGYSELSADRLDSLMILEMRDDIATGLATISTAVPGLGVDPGGFMSFGFGLDLQKAREFFEARVTAIEDDPFECELFENIVAGAAMGRETLNQPIPPFAYNFRGFVATITDADDFDFMQGAPPKSIDATILLAIEDVESMLGMAAMMVPQLATLNLTTDGKAVRLEQDEVTAMVEDAFAAMSPHGLAISVGDNAKADAEEALVADSGDAMPFMSFSMDAARYYALLGETMMQQQSSSKSTDLPMEVRESLRDMMIITGELYERMAFDVRFTSRGVEIDARVTMAD